MGQPPTRVPPLLSHTQASGDWIRNLSYQKVFIHAYPLSTINMFPNIRHTALSLKGCECPEKCMVKRCNGTKENVSITNHDIDPFKSDIRQLFLRKKSGKSLHYMVRTTYITILLFCFNYICPWAYKIEPLICHASQPDVNWSSKTTQNNVVLF